MSSSGELLRTDSNPGELYQQPDTELVRNIASGDKTALAQLYDRYAPTLLSLGQRFLGSRDDAEDLIHDLFIEVWQRADSYDPQRGSVRTWLLLRTRSRALDRLRSSAWRLFLGSESPEKADALRDSQAQDEDLLRRATEDQVRNAVLVLSAEERGLVELIYVKGCSLSEVAGQLDAPLGTVKSRLSRLLGKLRRSLNQPASEV